MEPDVTEDIDPYCWWTGAWPVRPITGRIILSYDQLRRAYDLCEPSGRIILNPSPLQEPNMTKKNFIEIAKRLNFFYFNPDLGMLIDSFCEYFNSLNPSFDKEQFLSAVYKER